MCVCVHICGWFCWKGRKFDRREVFFGVRIDLLKISECRLHQYRGGGARDARSSIMSCSNGSTFISVCFVVLLLRQFTNRRDGGTITSHHVDIEMHAVYAILSAVIVEFSHGSMADDNIQSLKDSIDDEYWSRSVTVQDPYRRMDTGICGSRSYGSFIQVVTEIDVA